MKSSMLFQCDPSYVCSPHIHLTPTLLLMHELVLVWTTSSTCGLTSASKRHSQASPIVFWFALVYYMRVEERQKQGRPENTYHVNDMEVKPHPS